LLPQEKGKLIDKKKHHVLTAAHPSGLSASRGFFGCRHWSAANRLLQQEGQLPIDWQIE
jgi:uracil-DNA glycosylase